MYSGVYHPGVLYLMRFCCLVSGTVVSMMPPEVSSGIAVSMVASVVGRVASVVGAVLGMVAGMVGIVVG